MIERTGVTARTVMTGLGTLALAVSAYLTATHYWQNVVPLACSSGGLVNCELVTSSRQSMLGAVPVALLGLVWCIGLLALIGLERRSTVRGALAMQLGWTGGGLAFVFYLLYSELFLIGAICLWCTVVHVLVVAIFLLSLYRMLDEPTPIEPVPAVDASPEPARDAVDVEAGRLAAPVPSTRKA